MIKILEKTELMKRKESKFLVSWRSIIIITVLERTAARFKLIRVLIILAYLVVEWEFQLYLQVEPVLLTLINLRRVAQILLVAQIKALEVRQVQPIRKKLLQALDHLLRIQRLIKLLLVDRRQNECY
jgi:hypothetical protein